MSTKQIANALSHVFDPELGIDIVSLGLLYGIEEEPDHIRVQMTTTFSGCPMGDAIVESVERILSGMVPEGEVEVEVVHDPPWNPAMLSEEAKRALGMA